MPVARLVLEQSYTQSGATPGSAVTLNATFTNTGQVPYTGISVASASAGTVDDAIPNGDQVASSGTLVLNATGITWTGDIPVGGVVTVTGTLTREEPGHRQPGRHRHPGLRRPGQQLPVRRHRSPLHGPARRARPRPDDRQDRRHRHHGPGGTVGYTITVTNSGQTPYTGATFTDPLAGVLDDAVYNGDATATTGTVGFAGTDSDLDR